MGGSLAPERNIRCALEPHCMSLARWWFGLTERTSQDFSKRRVLIADDERVVRDILSQVLVDQVGCQVTCVRSGVEAIEALENEGYDVLITDMIMPGLHGLELISMANERWPGMDIIVMTGFPQQFPYVEVVRQGASDFIAKPHLPQEMEAKLLRLFKERELREQLFLAEEKYRSIFELSMSGNALLDPDTLHFLDANRALCDLTGRSKSALVGRPILELLKDSDKERFVRIFEMFRSSGQGTLGDVSFIHSSGKEMNVDINITHIPVPGDRIVFLTVRDVTERTRMEQQLAAVAHTDSITGLANKRSFQGRLRIAHSRALSRNEALSLVFLDLDNFKNCNDTFGHQTGDQVLQSVGTLIHGTIRGGKELGFRYGGDEFAILLPDTSKEDALVVAERMRKTFEEGQRFGTSMSIGIAQLEHGMSPDEFVRAADKTLYIAKARGKNTTAVH